MMVLLKDNKVFWVAGLSHYPHIFLPLEITIYGEMGNIININDEVFWHFESRIFRGR